MNVSSCPHCGSRLFQSELKANRCSGCNRRLPDDFIAEALAERPAPRGPLTWEEVDPSTPADDARVSRAGWGPMNLGLRLLYWGWIGYLLTWGAQSLWLLLARQGWMPLPAGGGGWPYHLTVALGLLALASALVVLIGALLCCSLPRDVRGRGWGGGVALSAGGGLLVIGAAVLVYAIEPALRLGQAEQALALLLAGLAVAAAAFLGSLCFALLLRAAARFWGDNALGLQFVIAFVLFWAALLVFLGMVLLVALLAGTRPVADPAGAVAGVVVILAVVLVVVLLALSVWFLLLLARLSQHIPD